MKLNEHISILSPYTILVPYSEDHVPVYHEWMQDEELQKATASEPLTLAEEYSMQKSWRQDADKLTFIIAAPPLDEGQIGVLEREIFQIPDMKYPSEAGTRKDMIVGDVNLFLFADDEEEEEEEDGDAVQKGNDGLQKVVGELEIMIAQKAWRGKGLGKAVLLAFMWYIVSSLDSLMSEYHSGRDIHHNQLNNKSIVTGSGLKYLRVKIDQDNASSIALFESVGFSKVSEKPNYFGELELRRSVSATDKEDLETKLGSAPLVLRWP